MELKPSDRLQTRLLAINLRLAELKLVPSCGATGDASCTLNMPGGVTPAADPDVIKVSSTPTPTASCNGSTVPGRNGAAFGKRPRRAAIQPP